MKIPFVDFKLYKEICNNTPSIINDADDISFESKKSNIQTQSRSSTIVDSFIGKTLNIYNGKRFLHLNINAQMIGFKLGCFIFTKKLGKSIHNSLNNRKKIAKMKRKITQKKDRKTVNKKVKKKKKKKK